MLRVSQIDDGRGMEIETSPTCVYTRSLRLCVGVTLFPTHFRSLPRSPRRVPCILISQSSRPLSFLLSPRSRNTYRRETRRGTWLFGQECRDVRRPNGGKPPRNRTLREREGEGERALYFLASSVRFFHGAILRTTGSDNSHWRGQGKMFSLGARGNMTV